MDVGEGYRIPRLEEFVQGFEFEVAHDSSFGFLNLEDDPDNIVFEANLILNKTRQWIPSKVTWMAPKGERIIEKYGGYTFNISSEFNNFFKPFDEQAFIDQGLVRVKI